MDTAISNGRRLWLIWGTAGFGVLWNAYGIQQFFAQVGKGSASMMDYAGMTAEQAMVMSNLPFWMTGAFAIGVLGGLVGSILLFMRKKLAEVVFHVSLVSYIALYIGDIVYGVFGALGTEQVVVLTTVVAIAAGLSFFSRKLNTAGKLT